MKKLMMLMTLILCLILAACGNSAKNTNANAEQPAAAVTVNPLPDTAMDNITDAILAVSLEEGGAYVDDTGAMQMDVTIYSYDKYDMVDISVLKVGDILVTYAGEVKVTTLERSESGLVFVNGGLENGGFDLLTNESGIYYEIGFDDAKNWHEVGKATIRVSTDFECYDNADPDKGEVVFYPGDFLAEGIVNYDFTPHNTTVRVEEGQIVEMNRVYVP